MAVPIKWMVHSPSQYTPKQAHVERLGELEQVNQLAQVLWGQAKAAEQIQVGC